MAKNDHLFLLIQSLTKSEKRYFKLFASVNRKESNYLKLFDAIAESSTYEESDIRKKFTGHKFIKQLHVTKIKLTELILHALVNFNSKNDVTEKVLGLLLESKVLFEKELYDLCFDRIEKAERLAIKFEKLTILIQVFSWKRRLVMATTGDGVRKVGKILEAEETVITKLKTLNEFWEDSMHVYETATDEVKFSKAAIGKIENANSLQAKILHHHFLFTKHYVGNDQKSADVEVSKLIRLLEQHPQQIKEDPALYVTTLMNKIVLLLSLKRWPQLVELLSKVRTIITSNQLRQKNKFTARIWMRMYNVELEMYRDQKDCEKGVRLIGIVHTFITARKQLITPDYLILYYYQFAHIHFLNNDYSSALKWVNEVINANFRTVRLDIQKYTRLLNLVLHFELRNISVLRYAANSAKRFMRKHRIFFEPEQEMISLFLKVSQSSEAEFSTHFRQTLRNWKNIEEQKRNQIEDYFHVSDWLKTKFRKPG